MSVLLVQGDARTLPLADASVDCTVCSPPYWGLRSYGIGPDRGELGGEALHDCNGAFTGHACGSCWICAMRRVFAEVHRVLVPTGTVWCNVGDAYASGQVGFGASGGSYEKERKQWTESIARYKRTLPGGLKPKNLLGLPWRLALALQADGWTLRSEIIWHKCLSGGATVYAKTQKGEMPMMVKDLVRLDPSTVQLWDGEKWNQCHSFEEQPEHDGNLEIELRNGERIGCTKEHKWPLEGMGMLMQAQDLRPGHVLQPTRLPEPKNPRMPYGLDDDDIGWFVGLYLAEGWRDEKAIRIASHSKEHERFARCCHIAEAYDGSCTWTRVQGHGSTMHIRGPILQGIIDTYVSGELAYGKHLHPRCWKRSNRFLKALLDGYLHGDGHKAGFRWRVGFCENDALASDLRTLCSRVGYSLHLRRCMHTLGEKKFPGWRGDIAFQPTDRKCPDTQIVAIRQSRARKMWSISLHDNPHLFALTCGVLTANSNPMPESVQDRPTRSHEYVFLFSKQARYHFDMEAVREPHAEPWRAQPRDTFLESHGPKNRVGLANMFAMASHREYNSSGRAMRSVLSLASEPCHFAHFATFPTELVRRCLLAGAPQAVCTQCGKPHVRQVARGTVAEGYTPGYTPAFQVRRFASATPGFTRQVTTTGFTPSCACTAPTRKARILDPFVGSGTVGLVARELGHDAVCLDLSITYLRDIARERLGLADLHRWSHGAEVRPLRLDDLPLFAEAHL